MYVPRGYSDSDLGDVEVVVRDGVLHLFHLTLPKHEVILHAVSTDGIRWEPRPPVLATGELGAFDDDQLWTMGIVFYDGRYYMLYTALSRAEGGRVQRVGLAVSDDLDVWKKLPQAVSEATGPHYVVDRGTAPWVAWRDPKPVVLADGLVHAVVCARDPAAPALRQAAVAHLVSRDLETWEVRPPLFTSRRHVELECPQLFSFAGRFYLTAAVIEERLQRYWVSDDLEGPFRTPLDNRLGPPGHYAARICEVGDESWLFAFHDPAGGSPPNGRFVPAPLVLVAHEDGRLSVRRTAGWDARFGEERPIEVASLTPTYAARHTANDGARLASLEGLELFGTAGPRDFVLRAALTIDAPFFGVGIGATDDGAGVLVSFDRGAGEVAATYRSPASPEGHPAFTERVLARGPAQIGGRVELEVIYAEGELIVSLDGAVVLSTGLGVELPANFGLAVDSGAITVDALSMAEIHP